MTTDDTMQLGIAEAPGNGEAGQAFSAAPCSAFRCIVADPPWRYNRIWCKASDHYRNPTRPGSEDTVGRRMPYPEMTMEQIKTLPVGSLAAENCDLYLWVTQKYLPDAFDVLNSWGFRYCQTLTWCKTPRGTGQGGLYCPTTEFLILGRKGKMPDRKRVDSTWWNVKRPHNCHSAKPEFFQDMIEAMSDAPRLELFARRKRLGWHHWGNEVASDVILTPNDQADR
jgi:N6-adenosine-specific RNA methylase IME4